LQLEAVKRLMREGIEPSAASWSGELLEAKLKNQVLELQSKEEQ